MGGATRIAVVDVATGEAASDPIVLTGNANGGLQFTPDGTKAFQTTYTINGSASTTQVYTIDPATGTVGSNPIVIAGFPSGYPNGNLVMSPNGSRATQVTAQGGTTIVTVINTATGEVVGDPITLTGLQSGNLQLADGGSKAIVVMGSANEFGGGLGGNGGDRRQRRLGWISGRPGGFGGLSNTTVTIIDLASGTTVGTVIAAGSPNLSNPVALTPDGKKAVLITGSSGSSAVTVIDVTTGTTIGTAPAAISGSSSGLMFNQDGSRAYVTVFNSGTRVAVIDTTTGANVGDIQISSAGVPVGGLQRGPDDTRAFQTINVSGADSARHAAGRRRPWRRDDHGRRHRGRGLLVLGGGRQVQPERHSRIRDHLCRRPGHRFVLHDGDRHRPRAVLRPQPRTGRRRAPRRSEAPTETASSPGRWASPIWTATH